MSTIRLYCGRDTGEMVRKLEDALVNDKPVSSLEIRETVLEDDVIEAIVVLIWKGSVERIHLDDCGAYLNKSAVRMARALGNCRHVRLSEPTFLSKFFLESFLASATKLKSLRIQDRLLVDQVEALSKGLRSNNTLHTLDLSRSRIDDFSILAEGLRGRGCVKKLKLRSIGLQDDHVAILMSSLESCPVEVVLESLDLSFNHLRNLASIGKFLRCPNCNLRELSIGFQNMWQTTTAPNTNIDMTEIAKALKMNKTLITLKLPRNELSDSDAFAFATALIENSTLEVFDVRENNISDIGITRLAETARDSKALRRLHVLNNPFGTNGALALLEAASKNFKIDYIDHCKDDKINKEIRYHTALNRGGRKFLLEDPPLSLWPLVMEHCQYNCNCLEEQEQYPTDSIGIGIDFDVGIEAAKNGIDMRSDVLYYLLKESPTTFIL